MQLGENLAKAEKQINEQNKLFKEGKSTFYEQLNEFSDLSKSQFEKEKEGAKIPRTKEGRGLGAILPPESEWYTSPELRFGHSCKRPDVLWILCCLCCNWSS